MSCQLLVYVDARSSRPSAPIGIGQPSFFIFFSTFLRLFTARMWLVSPACLQLPVSFRHFAALSILVLAVLSLTFAAKDAKPNSDCVISIIRAKQTRS